MRLADFRALLTREGQWAIESALSFEPREKDFLSDFQMLSKRFERELARSALTTAILRLEAEKKTPHAGKMYFTREALEQSTPWTVSAYRAQRYQGFDQLYDLGCSIGSDTLALAQIAPTIGLELDPLRVAMAQANAAALRAPADFIQADLNALPLSATAQPNTAVFFDPARRSDHRRAYSVADYRPPLSIVKQWAARWPAIGVKVSPGVKWEELTHYDCEVEFISLNGDMKEAMLWFGPLKKVRRRATLLPADGTSGSETLSAETPPPTLPLSEPLAYIYEPDPAVLRAGLVTLLGEQLDAKMLDPQIAYLTADQHHDTPFARVWEVEDWLPFQLKRLRAYLRERNVGRLTVKKRGSPILPEDLIRDLRLEGEEEKILFLTQMQDKPIVVVAKAG